VLKNRAIIAIIFAIISFFVFRHCITAGISIAATVSSSVLYPFLRMQQVVIVPIAKWFEERSTIRELQNNLDQLQKAHEDLYAENIVLKSLRCYAAETDELRNFNKRYALHSGHMAQILARHFSANHQFFLVDAGATQGIKKDMVALYGNNIVGKVIEVYPWYCKVSLITDSDCKVAITCVSAQNVSKKDFKKGVSGIHEGINNATSTIISYVSHLESVEINDTVLSSGEGLVFPKGFALGKIIGAEKGDLFYVITVEPLLNLQTLQYCTLIAKEDIER
jgi:rod shape-determining protein MreC